MSVNTANTPDGRGVLIYNGEMILLYTKEVVLHFANEPDQVFKGKKVGSLYLTSHRVIFVNHNNEALRSFSMPFHCMRAVKLEQPVFGANYLKGVTLAQPGGNWSGEVTWKLSFNKGGCIDFGQALLKAADMAGNVFMYEAPPPYTGIGPDRPPMPAGSLSGTATAPPAPEQTAPPSYEQATVLPQKA
uniref:GRAM domain-containing protein n=1 Tax=Ascaris lumbricoides TaxID=6252 RepID=A0A0M3I3B0_ASCLU